MERSTIAKQHILYAEQLGYTCDEKGVVYGPSGNALVSPISKGRRRFTIRIDKIVGYRSTKTVQVHRFVAYFKYGKEIFKKDVIVRHLDGNPLNNSYPNIALGSQKDNMQDRPKEQRVAHAKHAASFIRLHTDEEEQEIYNFYTTCRSYKSTIEKFSLSNKNMLFRIIKKHTAHSSNG